MNCIKIVTDDGKNRRRCRREAIDGKELCPLHLRQSQRRNIHAKEIADAAIADWLRRQRQRKARAKRRAQS